MRFKTDENLHDDVAALLTARGHDVQTVHDQGMRGCKDAMLAERCRTERRAIVTLDRGFADIRVFPPPEHPGMIVLRLRDQSRGHVLAVLSRALDLLTSRSILGELWIVSEAGVRIRG